MYKHLKRLKSKGDKENMVYEEQWSNIKKSIGMEGKECSTFTIIDRSKTYFFIKISGKDLEVTRSINKQPTCKINTPRKITYSQFEDVYKLYPQYINKEKGIREQMRNLNNNTSYIISIIRFFS